MQPKYSQAAFDAFATQQGLDEEYRQKLAALMGVQPPPAPMAADAGAMVGGMDPYAPPPMDMYAQTPPANYTPAAGFSEVVSDAPQGLIERAPEPPRADAALWKTDPKAYIEQENARRAASTQEPNLFERAGAAIKGLRNTPENYKPAPPKEAGGAAEGPSSDQQALDEAKKLEASTGKTGGSRQVLDLRGGSGSGISASSLKQLEKLGGMAAGTQQGVEDAFKNYGEAEANQMAPIAAANQNVSDVYGDISAVKKYEAQVLQQRQKQFESKFKEVNDATKQEQDKLMGMDPLDPNRAWKQADIGGKLGIALSYIGAAFAMNYGNDPNAAQRTTEAIFGRDLEKQKMEYEKQRGNVDIRKNQYAALMAQYKDETAAQAAYFEPIYESLANKISQHVASGKAGQASAQMDTIGKQFALKAAEMKDLRTQSALQQAQAHVMRSGPSMGAGDNAILLDKKAQDEMRKQLINTPYGAFLFPSDAAGAEAQKQAQIKANMSQSLNEAIALAKNTTMMNMAVPDRVKSKEYITLIGKLKALGMAYGHEKGAGAYDKGLADAVEKIIGNPSMGMDNMIALLSDNQSRLVNEFKQLTVGNPNVRQAKLVDVVTKGNAGQPTTAIVPGVQNAPGGGIGFSTPVQGPR